MEAKSPVLHLKLVLVGAAGVGKSRLYTLLSQGYYPVSQQPTSGVEFATKEVRLDDDQTVKVHIWDTAGLELQKAIVTAHFRTADAAILVFDLCDEASFHALEKWVSGVGIRRGMEKTIAVVGTKLDLAANQRQVATSESSAFAQRLGLRYFELSANDSATVTSLFTSLLRSAVETERPHAHSECCLNCSLV